MDVDIHTLEDPEVPIKAGYTLAEYMYAVVFVGCTVSLIFDCIRVIGSKILLIFSRRKTGQEMPTDTTRRRCNISRILRVTIILATEIFILYCMILHSQEEMELDALRSHIKQKMENKTADEL